MGDKVFTHLLNMEKNKEIVLKCLLDLFDEYFNWIKENQPFVTGKKKK